MKLYSISFTAVVMALLWVSLNLPDPGNNVNPTSRVGGTAKTRVIRISDLIKPLTNLSGNYRGTGYNVYGPYIIDVSGYAPNTSFSISWSVYDVPNRFTLRAGTASSTSNWQGTANYAGPWGYNLPFNSYQNTGSFSINKGTSTSIELTVETVNDTNPSRLNDAWAVTY